MKKYVALSILFLFLSFLGGIFLFKGYQNDNYSSPITTPTPFVSPKPSDIPTSAPIFTSTISPTPFVSPKPSDRGRLPTLIPTNTPIPTEIIEQSPTPTRIILPKAGIEFPSQVIVVIGGIVTLLGFLILL